MNIIKETTSFKGKNPTLIDLILTNQSQLFMKSKTFITGIWHCHGHTGVPGLLTQVLDAGLWTLDSRRSTLDTGLWTLDSGCWTLDAGLWKLDSGIWTLAAWLWTLDPGRWTLDTKLWTLGSDWWTLLLTGVPSFWFYLMLQVFGREYILTWLVLEFF